MMGLPLERLPDWPASLDWEESLAYTGVAETELKAWVRRKRVRFAPRGPHGARICPRADLDAALREMFDLATPGVHTNMEF